VSTSEISTLFGSIQLFSAMGVETEPSDNTLIGSRVRAKRISRRISQQEFCQQLGVDSADLNAYEAGDKRINANLLMRVAKLLDVPPVYFFRMEAKEKAKAA
jgi:transcriptional regulator with XRE-family HTH domain